MIQSFLSRKSAQRAAKIFFGLAAWPVHDVHQALLCLGVISLRSVAFFCGPMFLSP
jgi:hypothetical protein